MPRRPTRKFRAVPGENPVILGRKFCSYCGHWRLLMEFGIGKYQSDGETPLYFQAHCTTCTRVRLREKRGHQPRKFGRLPKEEVAKRRRARYHRRKQADRQWLEDRRERQRFESQKRRREEGIQAREWQEDNNRGGGIDSYADAVDSGPFLEWLGRWRAYQDDMRSASMAGVERPVASLEDLAELAKCSPRAFSRAKTTGRITTNLVDRVLIAAGGNTMLWELYPELYPDDVEVAA